MAARIAFALCEHYRQEGLQALAAENLAQAVLITFPARCGRPPLGLWRAMSLCLKDPKQ